MSLASQSATDLDAVVADLRRRITAATTKRLRIDVEREAAQQRADEARARLAGEFGVSSVEEATATLAALRADIAGQVQEITTILDGMGL